MINPDEFDIRIVNDAIAKEFVIAEHYAKGTHKSPFPIGLYHKDRLVAICMFCTPGSESVRSWPFGEEYKDSVTELHRLAMLSNKDWPERPRHILSWFLTKVFLMMRNVKPHIKAAITFADTTEGHEGTIYRACNALYYGLTRERRLFWKDETGRLRHPRQNGKNISKAEALELGWVQERREKKHKFLFLIGSKKEKRKLYKMLVHKPLNGVELGYEKEKG